MLLITVFPPTDSKSQIFSIHDDMVLIFLNVPSIHHTLSYPDLVIPHFDAPIPIFISISELVGEATEITESDYRATFTRWLYRVHTPPHTDTFDVHPFIIYNVYSIFGELLGVRHTPLNYFHSQGHSSAFGCRLI